LLGLAGLTLAGACGGSGLPTPAALAAVSATDGQTGFAGARLPQPLAVTGGR
jgi:hypothetical protein